MGMEGGKEGKVESITILLNLYCEIHKIDSPYINKLKI